MTKEYIAYRGEQPLGTGTIEELADKLGYTYKNMKYKSYPAAHRKAKDGSNAVLLYEIKEDDEDEF